MTEKTQIRCRLCPTDINSYEITRASDGLRLATFNVSCPEGVELAETMFAGLLATGALPAAAFIEALKNTPTEH